MRELFPLWWRCLAGAVIVVYIGFATYITVTTWDVLAGNGSGDPALDAWRMFFWAWGVAGGAAGAMGVVVFSHAMGIAMPLAQKRRMELYGRIAALTKDTPNA